MEYKGITYTADQIKEMREWLKECQWADIEDNSEIDEFSDLRIVKAVERHADGGLTEFINCSTSQKPNDE